MSLTLLRHATQKPPPGILNLDIGHPLAAGLVTAFVLNEVGSSTVNNYAAPGMVGTQSGGVAWGAGAHGPARLFASASSQYIDIPSTTALNLGSTFSVACWFYLNSNRNYNGLLSRTNGAQPGPFDSYVDSTGLLSFFIGNGTAGTSTGVSGVTTSAWHLFVGTLDGSVSGLKAYLDGTMSTQTGGAAVADTSNNMRLGSRNDVVTLLDGRIESAFTWKRVLSASEIALLYSEPYAMFQARPVQRWIVLFGDQHARPSANVTVGTWLDQSGANTNLFGPISEVTIDDTTYIQSAANPQSDLVEVSLSAVSDPLTQTGHVLRYRTRLDTVVTGSGAMSLVTELRQGTAALSTAVTDTIAPASITETTNTVTLSAAQADAITDYSLLRLRSTATQAQAAAPTFVAAGTFIATATNAASITPGLPAGTNGQDILLLCIERGDNTAATALTGWTNIAALTANDTTAQRVEVWWRVAAGTIGNATSTTAIAITFGSSTIVRAGQMFAFRGADVTTPFVLSSFKTNVSGNTCATTDISPTITNTLGFFAAMAVGQRTAATTPSGWAAPVVNNTALGNDTSIAYTTKTFAASGSYGAPSTTWTSTTTGVTEGVLFAIQPPVNASKARITWAELEVPAQGVMPFTRMQYLSHIAQPN